MRIKCSLCGKTAVCVAECEDGDRPTCNQCGDDVGLSFRRLPKIGPAMLAALVHVYAHPGESKGRAATVAAQGGRLTAGYRAVDRCILAGLVESSGRRGAAELHLTRLGELITPYPDPAL